MPSFYLPELTDDLREIRIEGEEFHHLSHVFRRKPGDEIALTNGKGILARAVIKIMEKRSAHLEILNKEIIKPAKPILAAAFSLLKNKHDHLIVEKLTELGVREFFPVICERTVRKESDNAVEKLNKVAVAAIKQCDNAYLPIIHPVMELMDFLEQKERKDQDLLVALESEKENLLNRLLIEKKWQNICFLIGPEGGFTGDESRIMSERNDITTYSLGNHIMRAETAAIASASLIVGHFLQQDPEYY